jgi:hypothetical protein
VPATGLYRNRLYAEEQPHASAGQRGPGARPLQPRPGA